MHLCGNDLSWLLAGIIGLRGPDIEKRLALRGYKVQWADADRPIVRPHTGLPVLRILDGEPIVQRHVFGFSKKFTSFNARDDKLDSSPMWSKMYGVTHGIAPVSYILEWSDHTGTKLPYRIERADGAAMCVPALVGRYWENADERAFALVTTKPDAFVGQFHNRMIAQLNDDELDVWLRPGEHNPGEVAACISGGADELVAYPLDTRVSTADEDDVTALKATGPRLAGTVPRAGELDSAPAKTGPRQTTL